ncbi:MAG: ABC transporter substrate-binding protein [Proteobacteria bacterium]|nr:ABC transporter substrate-binding protein [Pseudomonadota bacterium]
MSLSRLRHGLGAVALASVLAAGSAGAESVIRVAAESDLKSLDPIWTTAAITAGHGFMVYDQLFAQNVKGEVKPQMVESWKASPDGLTWSFVLRPGLKWHDGTPVTAKDVAPSIKRWGARIAAGQILMTRVADIVALDERTFEIKLKDKFGPVVDMLGASAQPLFIMPEKLAMTDPFTGIDNAMGSGPFTFEKDKWVPGAKVSYRKFPGYVPRADNPDGYTGAKVVRVDGVEWTFIPDGNTAVQALIRGEVDFYEYVPSDLVPILKKDSNIVVKVINKGGFTPILRPNHLVAPTNNPKFRQAILYAMNQTESLGAMVGNKDLEQVCWAVFACGFPLETNAGVGDFAKPGPANIAKAKELLKEAGYNNEPIVLMNPVEFQVISAMTLMSGQLLKNVGINVDMQNMDWSTLISRRTVKDDPKTQPTKGWNIFHTWGVGPLSADPLTNNTAATPCDGKNWFGWPCDEALEGIRQKFITVAEPVERKKLAEDFQKRFYEVVPYVPLGMFFQNAAWRANVDGVLDNMKIAWWNASKK